MNGKGDSPRNCFSNEFRRNWDRIFRKKPTKKSNFHVCEGGKAVSPDKQRIDICEAIDAARYHIPENEKGRS